MMYMSMNVLFLKDSLIYWERKKKKKNGKHNSNNKGYKSVEIKFISAISKNLQKPRMKPSSYLKLIIKSGCVDGL